MNAAIQSANPEDVEEATRTAHRAAGQAYFESVLAKANDGADPFQQQPLKARNTSSSAAATPAEDPDVAAFGAFFEKHRTSLLLTAFIVSQAISWVLIKGALHTMQTPAVLTFLHLVAAVVVQLLLASWQLVEQPHISSKAAKGALVHAVLNGTQVLVMMAFLMHNSVNVLLSWVAVTPVLIEYSRAADISGKAAFKPVPQQLQVPLAISLVGLGVVLIVEPNKGLGSVLLLCWCCVVALQQIWRQVKKDATLGHTILDPDFLFRARELSDLEDNLSPSSLAFMGSCLPAVPILVLGFVSLEGKDLVDHEPSVPTLSMLMLSCLAFASAASCRIMLASIMAALPELSGLCMTCAAVLAILLNLLNKNRAHGLSLLGGVSMAVGGSLATHFVRWRLRKHTMSHSC